MERRRFLATLGAGLPLLGGCGSSGTESPTESPSESPTPSPSPTPRTSTPDELVTFEEDSGWIGAGSLLDLETIPRTYVLSRQRYRVDEGGEVRLKFDRTATDDHPARLVASLQNTDRYTEEFRLDWLAPFGRSTSERPRGYGERRTSAGVTHADSLVFAPTENHDLVDTPPSVRRDDDGLWRLVSEPTRWQPETVVLEPGEAVRGEYAVVGHPEGTGRPTGVYEFVRGQEDPLSVTVWNPETPGPEESSRFSGDDVPTLAEGEDESPVAWYHDADETTPSFVRPSTEQADLPAGVTFRFINRSRETLGCGHWTLYKLTDGEWFSLGPLFRLSICYQVDPGDTDAWHLDLFNGDGIEGNSYGDEQTFDFIGGGTYAAVVGFGHETGRSGALVELEGDQVDIQPTADAEAERDGSTVTVTTPRWRDEESESVRLRLTRADSAEKTLVAEQVMLRRYLGLRNTLPYLDDDVDEVVLRTDESVADSAVGFDSSQSRYRFRGAAYELSVADS
jgi:hypothetical protein